MKKLTSFLCAMVLVFGVVGIANSALIDRGGGLIYDSDQGITWLQDANYAQTFGYDADGRMDWYDAMAWADGLVYGGFDDWRLPDAHNKDGSGPDYGYVNGSELGHLYYSVLGNPANGPMSDTGPFLNVQTHTLGYYWSHDTAQDKYPEAAWIFKFDHGDQTYIAKAGNQIYAWAVHDGDIGAVPPDPVGIDIMPRTCPNECPIKGGGFVEVAILGTLALDVTDIDIASVRLEGVAPIRSRLKDKSSPVVPPPTECECTTEGRDGFIDLCLKFDKKEILSALGEVDVGDSFVLTLTGSLNDGTPIEGRDCIVMTQKGKKN